MPDEKFANSPFRDGLRCLDTDRLPRRAAGGLEAEERLRQARRTRRWKQSVRTDCERECEIFLSAMEGTCQSRGSSGKSSVRADGRARENAFFLAEMADLPKPAPMKKKKNKNKEKAVEAAQPVPSAAEEEDSSEEESDMARLLAPDDTDPAFARAMAGVRPLHGSGREIPPAQRTRTAPLPGAVNPLQDLLDGKLEFALSCTEEYVEGYVVGLDQLTVAKLRQGGFSPEASLDLHGLRVPQAFEALRGFFRSAWYRSMRCVLVVTGRGRNSPDGIAVLKEKLRFWFTQEPFKRVILAFCTARTHDGGPGSVYVLLRKYKKKGRVYWERMPPDEDLY